MSQKGLTISVLPWLFIAIVQLTTAAKTVKECERQLPASLKAKLCEIRQYKIMDGPEMDKHMDCVLKALGFVNAESVGQYHQLYNPMNAVEKDRKHNTNLETCATKSQRLPTVGQRANLFYKCLLESSSADAFKKVFDLTELVKAGKLPADAKYDKKVENMMKKIDAKICK